MAFSPPIYALSDWVAYLTAAAPVARAAAQFDLPATGMVWNVPRVTEEFDVEVQTENASLATSSPTATYGVADVQTLAGSALVSTQTFDRSGPGFQLDQLFIRQGARKAGTQLDVLTLQAILAGAQNITNSATSPTIGQLYADVARAASLLTTTEGTRLQADTVAVGPSNLLRWFQAQLDNSDRPILGMPQGDAMDAFTGALGTKQEGYSGLSLLGARLLYEDNFSAASAGWTGGLLVADMLNSVYVATAPPILDVLHAGPNAAALTATVNFRSYCAVSVTYPSGACIVSSSTGAYPDNPTFTDS
jgi:hypothetical protein